MDKEQQAKILSEIMEADEKNGLYHSGISKMEKTQTTVEWLVEQLKSKGHALITTEGIFINVPNELLEQAKQMEKKQIQKAFSDGQEIPINHPTLPMYSREEYYNDTYKS